MFKPAQCAAALALLGSSAMAATTVDVTFTDNDFAFYSGSFVATDTNDDGIIEQSEVTSFTTSLGASTLTYFGDYDYLTSTWSTTADGDYYYYATSGTRTLAVTSGDDITTIPTVIPSVPEPASAGMLAAGVLMAFAMRTRRR